MKLMLDLYQTEYGKGYLLFQDNALIYHLLPGLSKPEGNYGIYRKPGILARKIEKYFKGEKVDFNDKIIIRGTDFEKKVYNACRDIKYGMTLTYKELARNINSNAFRAVGRALGKNKLPIIIPCHRVVSGKDIGGWSGPRGMKEMLLSMEEINFVKS